MKRFTVSLGFVLVLLLYALASAPGVAAACNWSMTNGAVTATTCGIDAQSTEIYDYTATCTGGGDSATSAVLTVNTNVTVTLNGGAVGTPTKLIVGRISSPGTGHIVASQNYVTIHANEACFVTDADGDGYSPTPTTCSTTGGAGLKRKACLTAQTVDCGDGTANASPGNVTYRSGTFTNSVNASLDNDWNCNGTETKAFQRIYSCDNCTNSGGYASKDANTSGTVNQDPANTGWLTSAPECNVAATRYTVTDSTCKNPAVANCSAAITTGSVTQTCL